VHGSARQSRCAPRGLGSGIGGHHQHHVAEVRLATVGIGQHAAVHDLQQDVEDIRMRFLDLVQQQHAVRMLDDFSVSRPPWSKPT
jgi:hypothetical protein